MLTFARTWVGLEDIIQGENQPEEKDKHRKISYVDSKQISKLLEKRLVVSEAGQKMSKMCKSTQVTNFQF